MAQKTLYNREDSQLQKINYGNKCIIERGVKNYGYYTGQTLQYNRSTRVSTVIYRINKTAKEFLKDSPKYTVERLQSSEELRGDLKKKTFFVDEPGDEEQLVILSFGKDRVVVNMGILEENRVKDI